LEQERLGLGATLSSGSDSVFVTSISLAEQEKRSIFERNHTSNKMVFEKCLECGTECSCYTAFWKHMANSHPAKCTGKFTCKLCDQELAIDEWKRHEHPSVPCLRPGCVAKPRNLASMDYHAMSHHLPMKTCYLGAELHAINFTENETKQLAMMGASLIGIHLKQAVTIMRQLGEPIAIVGKHGKWSEETLEVKDLGKRRLDYQGSAFSEAETVGFFSATLEAQEGVIPIIKKMTPPSTIIYENGLLLMIAPCAEEQASTQTSIGMIGTTPVAGVMNSTGAAANRGAMQAIAVKTPPGIIDSQNTISATVNLNTLGADPAMIDIGGRTDNLATVAMMQKQLMTTVQVSTTMAANTLIKNIRYGMCAGRMAQWMSLHERFSGPMTYEIQVVGNGALSGSIGICWYYAVSSTSVPPPPTDPLFYDVNWATLAVNESSSITFQLDDARRRDFYRTTTSTEWSPSTGINADVPALGIFLKDELKNIMGSETSITINIYTVPHPDFQVVVPKGVAPAQELRGIPLRQSSVLLADIVGPLAYMATDQAFPSITPNAESLWVTPKRSKTYQAGYASLADYSTSSLINRMETPNSIIGEDFQRYEAFNFDAPNTPALWPLWYGQRNGGDGIMLKFGIDGAVMDVGNMPQFARMCGGYFNDQERVDLRGNPYSFWTEAIGNFTNNVPYMVTRADQNPALRYNVSMAFPFEDTCPRVYAAAQYKDGDRVTAADFDFVRTKVPQYSPVSVFGSYNFPLDRVGQSPYAVSFNISTRSQPLVSGTAPSTTVGYFPDATTYAFLAFLREKAAGQCMQFTIRDALTSNVLAQVVYDWDSGVCFTTKKGDMVIQNLCTITDATRLLLTDFQATTSGATPKPIDPISWKSRVGNVGNANAIMMSHLLLKNKFGAEARDQNPIFGQEQLDIEEESDDNIDDNVLLNGEDQSAIHMHRAIEDHTTRGSTRYPMAKRGSVVSRTRTAQPTITDPDDQIVPKTQITEITDEKKTPAPEFNFMTSNNPTNMGNSRSAAFTGAGSALASGLGNVAGGIGGMVMAVKEYELDKDRLQLEKNKSKDLMAMQKNEHAAAYNLEAAKNARGSGAAIAQLGGIDPNMKAVMQLDSQMATNYQSNA
jgi:outer membrane lipoprotein SlyB